MGDYFFLNGKILDASEASIKITDLALLRGFGVFDFLRTINKKPFLMDRYLDRLWNSAHHIGLEVPNTKDEISGVILELLQKNNIYEAGIRLVLTGGYTPNGFSPGNPNFFILIEKITFPTRENYENGIKLYFYEHQRELSLIKSINYLSAIAIRDKISETGSFDVLYHSRGRILEVSRSNFFLVRDKVLITPDRDVLQGITRSTIMNLAGKICRIEERGVSVDELTTADEAFMTGTTKKVLPVIQVGDHTIGSGKPGPVTRQIMELFAEYEKQTNY